MLAQNGQHKVNSGRYCGRSQGKMVDLWTKSADICHKVAKSPVEQFNPCHIRCAYESENIDNDL